MKNLNEFGVQELTTHEENQINGGGIIDSVLSEIFGDWENFKAGLTGSAPV